VKVWRPEVISSGLLSIGGKTITDSNYTHILAIVDRSGSMAWNEVDKEMTAALNTLFKEQAALDGKCLVDYAQFDTEFEKVYEDRPVAYATAKIEPRYGTALIDAIGQGTTELGRKLKALPETQRPGKVLVAVVTDGGENSSREYRADQVKDMLTEQQDKYGWDYVFLGANIDAVEVGNLYGFKSSKSMTFDTANTGETINSLNVYASAYRGTAGASAAFSDEDREKAVAK
jgi:hypothetical protein